MQGTGVCVTFDLLEGDGITDQPQDVASLTLNLENISDSMVWTNTDDNPTSEATGCYTPPNALDPGTYSATLRYTDKTDRTFIYNWQFKVNRLGSTAPSPLVLRSPQRRPRTPQRAPKPGPLMVRRSNP